MLNHAMEQTAYIIETSYNDDGDQEFVSSDTIACRFRWITELDNLDNREEIRSDALLWIKPDEDVNEGTIIKFDDDYFRVKRVIEARRLRGNQVYFKKCLMDKYAEGIEDAS
jgi:hypothetical protein